MSGRIVVDDGRQERQLLLVSSLVIGRDPTCDVSDDADSLLSRRHAEFAVGPGGVVVRDLGSRNGTFLNGARIAESAIRSGDIVRIGRLRVQYLDEPASGAASAGAEAGGERSTPWPPAPSGGAGSPDDVSAPVPTMQAEDDERTVFVPAAGPANRPAAPDPAGARPAFQPPPFTREALRVGPVERRRLAGFVAVRVTALAAVVFLAVAGAALVRQWAGRDAAAGAATGFAWLLPPLAVTVVAAYGVAWTISRRIDRLLPGGPPDGESGVHGQLDGARRAQHLER